VGRNVIIITTDCELEKPIVGSKYEAVITVANIGFTIPPPITILISTSGITLDNLIPGN